jgi:hypothetical protein
VCQNAGVPSRISQVWILKLATLPMDFHVAGGVKWKIDVSFSHLGCCCGSAFMDVGLENRPSELPIDRRNFLKVEYETNQPSTK